jgi:hypothetical protein
MRRLSSSLLQHILIIIKQHLVLRAHLAGDKVGDVHEDVAVRPQVPHALYFRLLLPPLLGRRRRLGAQ